MNKKITPEGLVKFNKLMAVLHFLQGILILVLSKSFSLPIFGSYLTFNDQTKQLQPATTQLFSVSLPILIAGFLFISALAHLLISTIYKNKYLENLKNGINSFRWYEYSISASIMMIAISLLVGIYDLVSLMLIFTLVAVMNLCGLIMEVHNQTTKKTSWISFVVGSLAGIAPWIAVATYFIVAANNGSKPPAFVYGIFVSIFIFFNAFAINMILQYKKTGKWNNYLYGEKTYIILSLVAKSALAWQVFAGTLRP